MTAAKDILPRGYTTRDIARLCRVGEDTVRGWIRSGELRHQHRHARSGRPRYVVLPEHLAEWTRHHEVTAPPKPTPRRRRRTVAIDFFPD